MPRPFHPQRDLAAQHHFKKRLSTRREEGSARSCPASPSAAGDVCRRSAFRSDEPAATVLGTAGRPAPSRFPTHSPIHLFVRRCLSTGRNMGLSDPELVSDAKLQDNRPTDRTFRHNPSLEFAVFSLINYGLLCFSWANNSSKRFCELVHRDRDTYVAIHFNNH
jgi:hypothetical protein